MAKSLLTLNGKQFVVLPEDEYRSLKAKAVRTAKAVRSGKSLRSQASQDAGDVAESRRRLADPKRIPAAEAFAKLGF